MIVVEPVVVRGAGVGVQHDLARGRAFAKEDDFDGKIVSLFIVGVVAKKKGRIVR